MPMASASEDVSVKTLDFVPFVRTYVDRREITSRDTWAPKMGAKKLSRRIFKRLALSIRLLSGPLIRVVVVIVGISSTRTRRFTISREHEISLRRYFRRDRDDAFFSSIERERSHGSMLRGCSARSTRFRETDVIELRDSSFPPPRPPHSTRIISRNVSGDIVSRDTVL